MSEFKLDDITTDSDLSLLDKKFERGGDIYTAVMDTALGAMQKYGEIQEQKRIAIRQEEQYKIDVLNSVDYDANDPNSVAQARERIERIAKSDMTKADAMPGYSQILKNKMNNLEKAETTNRRVAKHLDMVNNPILKRTQDDGTEYLENYSAESFVEGGKYDSEGLKGKDLVAKMDEGIEYYETLGRKLREDNRLDDFTKNSLATSISQLETLKTYVAGGGTITDMEFRLSNEGMKLSTKHGKLSDELDGMSREMFNYQQQLDGILGNEFLSLEEAQGNLSDQEFKAASDIKGKMDFLQEQIDEKRRIESMLYDELSSSYLGYGGGSDKDSNDPLGLSNQSQNPDDKIGGVGSNYKTKDIRKSTIVQGFESDDGKPYRVFDLEKDVAKLARVAELKPQLLTDDKQNAEFMKTYNMIAGMNEEDAIMDYKINGKSLKNHFENITNAMEKNKNAPKPSDEQMEVLGGQVPTPFFYDMTEKGQQKLITSSNKLTTTIKKITGLDIEDYPPEALQYIKEYVGNPDGRFMAENQEAFRKMMLEGNASTKQIQRVLNQIDKFRKEYLKAMSGRYKSKSTYDVNDAPVSEHDIKMLMDEEGSKYYNPDGSRKNQEELERDGLIKVAGESRSGSRVNRE
tara:strand:+ start:295 stop:2187 length:1893 start_codon:yes stop_codon:yes gene_type:complete